MHLMSCLSSSVPSPFLGVFRPSLVGISKSLSAAPVLVCKQSDPGLPFSPAGCQRCTTIYYQLSTPLALCQAHQISSTDPATNNLSSVSDAFFSDGVYSRRELLV